MFNDAFESIHNDDLGEVVGHFHGEPIRAWDPTNSKRRDNDRLASDLAMRQALKLNDANHAEVLPGQILCPDSIIRRVTTLEAMGEDAFFTLHSRGKRITIEEATQLLKDKTANITWRPDGKTGPDAFAMTIDDSQLAQKQADCKHEFDSSCSYSFCVLCGQC